MGRRARRAGPRRGSRPRSTASWPRDNPAFLPDLAGALNNLGNRYSEAGVAGARREPRGQQALAGTPPSASAALLLTTRAAAAEAGHREAAAWLSAPRRLPQVTAGSTAAIHEQARRHRAAAPGRVRPAWAHGTGQPVPAWLTVDPDLLTTSAEAWIATETYDRRTRLSSPPIPSCSTRPPTQPSSEALLAVDEQEAQRYTALRAAAQRDGVEAAYRPLLLTILARQFAAADPAGQRALLAEPPRRPAHDTVARRDSTTSPARTTSAAAAPSAALPCST